MSRAPRALLALLLITIGLVFLLVNFGFIPGVTAVSLLNLVALVLILGGVDIAIGRRWPLAPLGIDVVVIGLGLALLATQPTFVGGPFWIASGGVAGDSDVTVPRQNVTALSLDINAGPGDSASAAAAPRSSRRTAANDDLRLRRSDIDRGGTHASVRIDQSGSHRVGSTAADVDARVATQGCLRSALSVGMGETTYSPRLRRCERTFSERPS